MNKKSIITAILIVTTLLVGCKKKETKTEEPVPAPNTPATGWVKKTSPTTSNLKAIKFFNANVGYAVGNNGTVLKTIDGGNTWLNKSIIGFTSALNYCTIVDTQTVWVSHGFGVYKTTNGGISWTSINTGLSAFIFNEIYFSNSTKGFVATSAGIGSTNDGGVTWAYVPSSTVTSFTNIKFTDGVTGWSNGASNIYKTTDGGLTWVALNEGLSQPAYCFFLNNNETWAAKSLSSDTIRKTSNGGTNWSTVFTSTGSGSGMKSIWFCDSNNGFQSRTLAEIQKTTNGGATWTNMTTPLTSTEIMNDFYFFSPTLGWAVGVNGTILKYTE